MCGKLLSRLIHYSITTTHLANSFLSTFSVPIPVTLPKLPFCQMYLDFAQPSLGPGKQSGRINPESVIQRNVSSRKTRAAQVRLA